MTTDNIDVQAGRVCVSIARETIKASITAARKACKAADVVEIRLDALRNIPVRKDINALMKAVSRPLLFTNRPTWEGGSFNGSEEDRLALLIAAAECGAGYIDLELKTKKKLRERLLKVVNKQADTKLIISWHDFSGTPEVEKLAQILEAQTASGAHIGKMVAMARDSRDVWRVLDLLGPAAARNFPLIAFSMGQAGMISRIATLERGGYMTYAAPDSGKATAPGQLTLSALRAIQKIQP